MGYGCFIRNIYCNIVVESSCLTAKFLLHTHGIRSKIPSFGERITTLVRGIDYRYEPFIKNTARSTCKIQIN